MNKNTGIEKKERNRKMYQYWKSHQVSIAAIGRMCHMTRQSAWEIIQREINRQEV
jgi:hypothetical protein